MSPARPALLVGAGPALAHHGAELGGLAVRVAGSWITAAAVMLLALHTWRMGIAA